MTSDGEQGRRPADRAARFITSRASRRGFLGSVAAVGAGLLGAAAFPSSARAQNPSAVVDAATVDALIRQMWTTPEYRELRPQIIGPTGDARYYDPATKEVTAAPLEIVPEVATRALGASSGQRHFVGLSFLLAPADQQRIPGLTMFPMAAFGFVDGELVTIAKSTPDIASMNKTIEGVGRSAGSGSVVQPFSHDGTAAVYRARKRYAEFLGAHPELALHSDASVSGTDGLSTKAMPSHIGNYLVPCCVDCFHNTCQSCFIICLTRDWCCLSQCEDCSNLQSWCAQCQACEEYYECLVWGTCVVGHETWCP